VYWNQRPPIEHPQGPFYPKIAIKYSLGFGFHPDTISLPSSIGSLTSHPLGDCLTSKMVQKNLQLRVLVERVHEPCQDNRRGFRVSRVRFTGICGSSAMFAGLCFGYREIAICIFRVMSLVSSSIQHNSVYSC
jgi:hypothetical protein